MDTFDALFPGAEAGEPGPFARYVPDVELGRGGMGVVWRVFDPALGRHVAMKVLRPDLNLSVDALRRFEDEVRLTAQLQHPAIVPVYEAGRLPDGRLYFTMKEIVGATLREVIATGSLRLRRVLEAFATVCQAVAYAHGAGVLHRDLKPDNIMLGELGEVLVMDWGVARLMAGPEAPSAAWPEGRAAQTLAGALVGTPAYMAPELVDGQPPTPATDVYALGAVLFEILAGHPRFEGELAELLHRVRQGRGAPLPPDAPTPLARVCERAMALHPDDRLPSARALAEALRDWLDGVRLREQAMVCVGEADALVPEVRALREEARALRAQARALLAPLKPSARAELKRPAWALEDQAEALEARARQQDLAIDQGLRAALSILPSLPEAHERLAERSRAALVEAEARGDLPEAERQEALLAAHDRRRRHRRFLQGDGALTLHTDPPGAEVALFVIEEVERRLVPRFLRHAGVTPLDALPLPRGRYLLEITAPGRAVVRYPVTAGRLEHWDGRPPGEDHPAPVWLPPEGCPGPDEVYVPAGWARFGGDPEALDALPAHRAWVDGFILRRRPLTRGEHLALVEHVLATDPARAEALFPMTRRAGGGEAPAWGVEGGRLVLPPGGPGDLELPAVCLSGRAAHAVAEAMALRSGLPWRLPDEREWEKAARGVDGRVYPWGRHFEATWACGASSHEGAPGLVGVRAFPEDEGVYGLLGMAGNASDWCATRYERAPGTSDRVRPARVDPEDEGFRVIRGGGFSASARLMRLASRLGARPDAWFHTVGLRLARSLPGAAGSAGPPVDPRGR